MIIHKTIWVFKHLRGFLIFATIALILIAGLKWDVTGFEQNIPDVAEIESFNFEYSKEHIFEAPDNIIAVREYHQTIIDNLTNFESLPFSNIDIPTRYVYLNYNLTNGKTLSRQYRVPSDFYNENMHMATLFESKEFKQNNYSVLFSDIEQEYVNIESNLKPSSIPLIDSDEIKELLAVLKQDILEESFDEHNANSLPIANLSLIGEEFEEQVYNGSYYSTHITTKSDYINIKYHYTHTIDWLKQKGYFDSLTLSTEDLSYISVTNQSSNDTSIAYRETYKSDNSVNYEHIPKSTPDVLIITDTYKMNTLLQNWFRRDLNKHYYDVTLVFKNNYVNVRLEKDTAPDFIKDYFN